jgi:hypothetical protein
MQPPILSLVGQLDLFRAVYAGQYGGKEVQLYCAHMELHCSGLCDVLEAHSEVSSQIRRFKEIITHGR